MLAESCSGLRSIDSGSIPVSCLLDKSMLPERMMLITVSANRPKVHKNMAGAVLPWTKAKRPPRQDQEVVHMELDWPQHKLVEEQA